MFLILLSIILCQADWIESDSCSEGLFLNNGVCAQCTSNCQRCTQLDACELCKPGYYIRNEKCSKCTLGCTKCLSIKECLSCKEEYILSNGGCFNCSAICDDCSEPGICKVCKSGYYVTSNKGCNRCRDNCWMCSDETHCHSCMDGYYLQTSDCIECPEGCHDRQCSRDNGECSKGCAVGFYTQFCNMSCSKGCREKECYKDNGICTNGCNEGYYGLSCQPCPEVCINRTCSTADGICIHGCVNGYYKVDIKGRCNKCPDNCKHCVDWLSCTSCIEGFFGQNCISPCRYCMPGGCALDGICINGCRDGFYQEQTRCWSCPNSCSKCRSTRSCIECKSGYFGNRCERKCPLNCIACDNVDNEEQGDCINCIHHTFGRFCEFSCSANCLITSNAVSSCFQENGTCRDGCLSGFTGQNCTEEMSTHLDTSTRVPTIMESVLGAALVLVGVAHLIVLIRRRCKMRAQSSGSAETDRRDDDIMEISIAAPTHTTVGEEERINQSSGSADKSRLYVNILERSTAQNDSLNAERRTYETLGNPDNDDNIHIYDTTV